MFTIIVIDNNVLFREGLVNLLDHETGIQVVGEASTILEAIDKLRDTEADLALVEAEPPDIEDLDGIRLLRVHHPHMQVALLSTHPSEDLLIYGVRNGARGFVIKNHSLAKFMASIRAIERGEAVIPRALVGCLLDEFTRLSSPGEQEGLLTLTQREIDVLCELGRGRTNRQIAENLSIAENTVKVHVHNILEKLNLRNRRQAARFVRYQGIVTTKAARLYAQPDNK